MIATTFIAGKYKARGAEVQMSQWWAVIPSILNIVVILSGVTASQSEAVTQSKDPNKLHTLAGLNQDNASRYR